MIAITLVLCVAIIAMAGGTLAYFSDEKEITNVYTSGNVYISLTEAAVMSDGSGNLVEDTSSARIVGVAIDSTVNAEHNYGTLYPGKTMHKDPTIKNTGDDPAWIAAKVIITDGKGDINKLYGYHNSESIDIKMMLSGGLLNESAHVGAWHGIQNVRYNDKFAMVQMPDVANGTYEFYFFFNNQLLKDEELEIFDTMTILSEFTNTEMQELAELEITVQAFAVQAFGFSDSFTAMKRAFPDHFEKFKGFN